MPGIQRLTIRSRDIEGRDLMLREAELCRIVDVVPEQGVDLVGV